MAQTFLGPSGAWEEWVDPKDDEAGPGPPTRKTITVESLFDLKISPPGHKKFLEYLRSFEGEKAPTREEVVAKFAALDSDVLDGERLAVVGRYLKGVTV